MNKNDLAMSHPKYHVFKKLQINENPLLNVTEGLDFVFSSLTFYLNDKPVTAYLKRGLGFASPVPDQREVHRLFRHYLRRTFEVVELSL
jgi:hypothetical protein